MKNILLAEDDIDFGAMLKQYLILNKFEVVWAKNGIEALNQFETKKFDICILDVMMPKMDGFTLAKEIVNRDPEVPFLFLTARIATEDRIKGLKIGADDYIIKPFEAEELILRLRNIIKRTNQSSTSEELLPKGENIQIGSYAFDTINLELVFNEVAQKMTEKEAQLLYFLITNRNRLIRREEILAKVWKKTDFFSGRSMDVFITRLRKRLRSDKNIQIKSVRGIGLEFNVTNN